MKPLLKRDGFKVNENLTLDELVENHPEMIVSKPLISNNGDHAGKSFVIYTYNLF
jgi:hypothetical protein